jgi:hypothetical protein
MISDLWLAAASLFNVGNFAHALAPVFDFEILKGHNDGFFLLDRDHTTFVFEQERYFQQDRIIPDFDQIDLFFEVSVFLVAKNLFDSFSGQNLLVAQKPTHKPSMASPPFDLTQGRELVERREEF